MCKSDKWILIINYQNTFRNFYLVQSTLGNNPLPYPPTIPMQTIFPFDPPLPPTHLSLSLNSNHDRKKVLKIHPTEHEDMLQRRQHHTQSVNRGGGRQQTKKEQPPNDFTCRGVSHLSDPPSIRILRGMTLNGILKVTLTWGFFYYCLVFFFFGFFFDGMVSIKNVGVVGIHCSVKQQKR